MTSYSSIRYYAQKRSNWMKFCDQKVIKTSLHNDLRVLSANYMNFWIGRIGRTKRKEEFDLTPLCLQLWSSVLTRVLSPQWKDKGMRWLVVCCLALWDVLVEDMVSVSRCVVTWWHYKDVAFCHFNKDDICFCNICKSDIPKWPSKFSPTLTPDSSPVEICFPDLMWPPVGVRKAFHTLSFFWSFLKVLPNGSVRGPRLVRS